MKTRMDVFAVGLLVVVGFSIILMKVTGYWPCDIINMLSNTYHC